MTWLAAQMPKLRAMLGFLEPAWQDKLGLYSVPGSLQVGVRPPAMSSDLFYGASCDANVRTRPARHLRRLTSSFARTLRLTRTL